MYQSDHGLVRVLPTGFNARPALSEFTTNSLHPDFSPYGTSLAFNVDDPDGTRDLWTSSWDGGDVTQVTRQGSEDDGFWMATFRTDGDGILATRVARPSRDLTIVSIAMDGTITDVSAGPPRLGAHPRQRRLTN